MNFLAIMTVVFIANGQITRVDLATETIDKCVNDIHTIQLVLSRLNSPIVSIACNSVQNGASR